MHRCARREIDQIISLNRERVRFRPSRKPQRMSIIPVVRGIFLTRRRSNYCAGRIYPSLSFPRAPRAPRLFCKHSGSTWAHGDVANRLIIGTLEGSLLFTVPRSRRIAPAEKFCGIWEVSGVRGADLLFASAIYRCIACLESFSGHDLILLIKTNEKKLKFKLSKFKLFRRYLTFKLWSRIKIYHLRKIILEAASKLLCWLIELYLLQNL